MKNSRKKITVSIVIILIAALLGWRLLPHSFPSVISTQTSRATSLACNVSTSYVSNVSPAIDTYVLQSTSDENDFKEIMKLLNSASYRQDFRNLLPWSITTVGSESNCSANIMLVWGDTATESCFISFQSESIVSVAAGTEGDFQIYHPTDRTVLGRLIDYVQLHGEQN